VARFEIKLAIAGIIPCCYFPGKMIARDGFTLNSAVGRKRISVFPGFNCDFQVHHRPPLPSRNDTARRDRNLWGAALFLMPF
jgi:hypothetical protein